MKKITSFITYEKLIHHSKNIVHVIKFNQHCKNSTMLISKLSEAINPNTKENHIGDGCTIDDFLKHQKSVRFIINGGFNHYRKNFYRWSHQNFNIGDPVGIVKIRQHYFEDFVQLNHYGFLTQTDKNNPWSIVNEENLNKQNKYILGCTPLLIFNSQKLEISQELLKAIPSGEINPPSVLGHGNQLHPRTAVGIKGSDIYFINVQASPGFTLFELQDLGISLKLDSLLNLDGGGSSQFRVFDGQQYIQNDVLPEDKNRILGHAIVIFDKELKEF